MPRKSSVISNTLLYTDGMDVDTDNVMSYSIYLLFSPLFYCDIVNLAYMHLLPSLAKVH